MAVSPGNRVLTTTQDKLAPKAVDIVLDSNPFASRVISNAREWSGETMRFPIKTSKNQTGTSFSGFDTFSTSATDNRQRLAFNPAFYQISASLPLTELSTNATEAKVLELAALEIETAAHDMADDIGELFFSDGSGNSSKDFDGLELIVDDGSNSATYGGLTRANVGDGSVLDSTVTASGGTLTLDKMATLYTDITSGAQKPSIGVTTESVFNLYEQLLQPQERIFKDVPVQGNLKNGGNLGAVDSQGFTMGTGATGLFYKGFPIIADENCTSQTLYFLNEDFLHWYALPMAQTEPVKVTSQVEGNDYSGVPGFGFSWSNWIKPTNAASLVGHLYLGGNLLTNNPKRHGKLTGVTSV